MTNSGAAKTTTLRLQQMLFGYDRGHGLLASSHGVPKTLASKILPDTDWDPRVSAKVDEYVSAKPVQGEKTYVLMKTWKAQEMPRPGCVWTHVLVINVADLSRIPDLRILAQHMKRPVQTASFETYVGEIVLEKLSPTPMTNQTEERVVRNLVELVYSSRFEPTKIGDEEGVENGLLAIWSQQWPALRRQFSFRSASLSRTRQARRSDFEIELKENSSTDTHSAPKLRPDVLELIVRDVMTASSSQFRRFLWRYGADAGADRENLLFLTRVYQDLIQPAADKTDIPRLINEIGKLFPKQTTALLLKKDLTQPSEADFSMLPAIDPFDVVNGVQSSLRPDAFPELGTLDQRTVTSWITTRSEELTMLLTSTADNLDAFTNSLFKGVANSKKTDFVWNLFDQSETVFLRILKSSIGPLDDDRIEQISDHMLSTIIQNAKLPSKKSVIKLVPRLLSRKGTDLIAAVHDAVPDAVTTAVIRQFAVKIESDQLGSSVHRNWVECVKDNPDRIIDFAQHQAESRRQLLACRYLLNADSKEVPLTVWSTRLGDVKNDLHGHLDGEFRVFLLIQALSQHSETAPIIFQDAFDYVYDALAGDRLNFRAEMQLSEYLPHIGWFNNWDKCLRLKIATVACYKHLGLSKKQLRKVTSNNHLEYELVELWSNS